MIPGLTETEASALARGNRCGCGQNLIVVWGKDFKVRDFAVRCLVNPEHTTYTRKANTRWLFAPDGSLEEFNVVTQKPINEAHAMVLPGTRDGMLQRVDEAAALGPRWAKDMSQAQRQALAITALAYGLDPLMEEMILYQGKPMITIKGRRRKDAEAGHKADIAFRFLSQEEKAEYQAADAFAPGDLMGYCILTTEWGNKVEGFGKVTKREREALSNFPNSRESRRSPIVDDNPIELWHKRAEDRARNMAYGPVPRPMLPASLQIIEGEGRMIEELPVPSPDPMPLQNPQDRASAPPAGGAEGRPRQLAPGPVCALHGGIRLGKHPELGMVHRLEDGTFCNGKALEKEYVAFHSQSPISDFSNKVADTPDTVFPPSQADDLATLKAEVESRGVTWENFQRDDLGMAWSAWLKLGGTVASARDVLQALQGGG